MEKKVAFRHPEYMEHKGGFPDQSKDLDEVEENNETGDSIGTSMDEETYKTFHAQDEKWSGADVDARQHLSHREAHSEYRNELTREITRYQVHYDCEKLTDL